jgi:hypothetical protein
VIINPVCPLDLYIGPAQTPLPGYHFIFIDEAEYDWNIFSQISGLHLEGAMINGYINDTTLVRDCGQKQLSNKIMNKDC